MMKDWKKYLWLLMWPAGFALYLTARFSSYAAEYIYARGLFRVYGWIVSLISGIFPFSLAEIVLIAVPLCITVTAAAHVVRIIAVKKDRLMRLLRLVRFLLIFAGAVFLSFMIGAGTNYHRYEFAYYSGLTIEKSDTRQLYELCLELTQKAVAAREEAADEVKRITGEDITEKAYVSPMSVRERGKQARAAMYKLAGDYEVLDGYYPNPKPVLFSRVMSEFNITGVYFPWTVEANVNKDVPEYTQGVTACHELSHLRGFMREDEANYIGYLACAGSDCPELRYSGYMLALTYSMNKLYADSPELFAKVREKYSEGMVYDLIAHSEYWKEFEETTLSEVGEKMNNAYLKANNQTDGTKSYGRMVDLLLAERRSRLGIQTD